MRRFTIPQGTLWFAVRCARPPPAGETNRPPVFRSPVFRFVTAPGIAGRMPRVRESAKGNRMDSLPVPWSPLVGPWERAENALARLDQSLAAGALAAAWGARASLAEAAASAWLDGAAVPLEDLVLHDADTSPRLPSPALFKARSVLLARRALARRTPAEVLTVAGILALHRRRRHPEENEEGEKAERGRSAGEGRGDAEQRLAAWLRRVADLDSVPALPAAAVAFQAWCADPPVTHGHGILGRLLIPVMLHARGKTRHHTLTFATGLQQVWPGPRRGTPIESQLAAILDAITAAAVHGLEAHRRLIVAKHALARPLAGRRSSSRLAALAELLLEQPLVSAPMAARHLGLSLRGATLLIEELVRAGCVVERTGRSRYRAFSLV